MRVRICKLSVIKPTKRGVSMRSELMPGGIKGQVPRHPSKGQWPRGMEPEEPVTRELPSTARSRLWQAPFHGEAKSSCAPSRKETKGHSSAFLWHPITIMTYPDPALNSRKPRPGDWWANGFEFGRCRIAAGRGRQHCGRNA
jgi:hypothetical protein